MSGDTLDPFENYLLLEPDGTALLLPGGATFWSQLMSGNPTDPAICRFMESEQGRLLTALSIDADWRNWEMPPAGDEILYLLEGAATFLFELADGVREIEFAAGRLLVVPRGVWHTAKVRKPARLLAITMGAGTQHRPA